jgi:hypothetical protein
MVSFLLLVGGAAAYAICRFAARLSRIGDQNAQGAACVANIEGAVWQLHYGVSQFIASPDPASQAWIMNETSQWVSAIEENITRLSANPRSTDEAQALTEFAGHYQEYAKAQPRWQELFGAGRIEEAAEWHSQAILLAAANMSRTLEKLVHLQQRSSDTVETQAIAEAMRLKVMLTIAVSAAVLIAVAGAVVISRAGGAPLAGADFLAGSAADTGSSAQVTWPGRGRVA